MAWQNQVNFLQGCCANGKNFCVANVCPLCYNNKNWRIAVLPTQKQNTQERYIQKLEHLINTQLLPAYMEYRKQQGLNPVSDIPKELLANVKKQNSIPALLKPIEKLY
jgi:hypothetical protein